jgi:hypothetical protein
VTTAAACRQRIPVAEIRWRLPDLDEILQQAQLEFDALSDGQPVQLSQCSRRMSSWTFNHVLHSSDLLVLGIFLVLVIILFVRAYFSIYFILLLRNSFYSILFPTCEVQYDFILFQFHYLYSNSVPQICLLELLQTINRLTKK